MDAEINAAEIDATGMGATGIVATGIVASEIEPTHYYLGSRLVELIQQM